jgi:EmrB/QacA subfamily drug resistance transporter
MAQRLGAGGTLILLALMLLVINYVETMVIPALPTIEKDFSTSATTAGWVTSAYLIVGAATAPLFGKLADRYGKKRMYIFAVAFYIVAVGIAGFSPNIGFLIGARAIQGLGFAIFPITIAIITDIFPRERVAFAQGVLSGMLGIGPALGLIAGSYIVQDLGWPFAFHTAFILSLIIFVLSLRYLRETDVRTKESVDYVGTAILMTSVVALLVYLTEGPSVGWLSAQNLVLLALGLIMFGVFIPYERRTREPLMKLSLFEIRNVAVANLAGLTSGIGMFQFFIAVVYYTQLPRPYGLGLTIIQSGLLMAPVALSMLVFGPLMGRLIQRVGPKPVVMAGAIIGALGFLAVLTYRATKYDLLVDGLISGVGLVSIIVPLVNMIAVSLPAEYRAVGLGMNTLLRALGSSVGPVVATVVMTTYQTWDVTILQGKILPVGEFPTSTAFNYIAIFGIILMLLTLVFSSFTRNYTFKHSTEKREGVEQAPEMLEPEQPI